MKLLAGRAARSGTLIVSLIALNSCTLIEWAMVEDELVVASILESAPFREPFAIRVDAHVAAPCGESTAGLPAAWAELVEAQAAVLASSIVDGAPGCSLLPLGRASKSGRTSRWTPADGGTNWRVPLGSYGIDGHQNGEAVISKSASGKHRVSFSWTFYPFAKLVGAVQSQTTAGKQGLKGKAAATFERTTTGWKLASLTPMPISQLDH